MKLSDYVWEYIRSLDIKHVFMLPGGGAMHLVDSLGRIEGLEYITLLHEQACSFAAETYARISNNMGAVLVTTGPGGTNAVTGCAAAWLESTPVIFISGQAKTTDLKGESGVRQKGNQEIGIVDIVSSITKYAVTIMRPEQIKYHLDKAVFLAKDGRPGPVWIDIPLDVQAATVEPAQLRGFTVPDISSNDQISLYMDRILELLKNAKRPVLIAGQGIERSNGKTSFQKLVEWLKIPVLTSWIAVDLLEYKSPYNFGKPGIVAPRYSNFAMQGADLIFAIGTRLDSSMIGYDPDDFAPDAKKIIVDIDPAELDKFEFDIEVKVVADATVFIEALQKTLMEKGVRPDAGKWLLQCSKWKVKYPVILEEFREDKNIVNPYHFIDILSDCLADDDIIIPGSSGAGIDVYWMCLKNRKNQRTLATGSLGSMGYGIPASIGACKASGKRTICVEGDGSFQLNIQELASIKGMNLPIKIFVNDNGGYLSIMNMQCNHFEGRYVGANHGSHLYLPKITDVAQAYGLQTFEITSHANMEQMIRKVLDTEGPVLCNVVMCSNLSIQPRVMSKVMPDGSMKSGTLRDLWPFLSEKEMPYPEVDS